MPERRSASGSPPAAYARTNPASREAGHSWAALRTPPRISLEREIDRHCHQNVDWRAVHECRHEPPLPDGVERRLVEQRNGTSYARLGDGTISGDCDVDDDHAFHTRCLRVFGIDRPDIEDLLWRFDCTADAQRTISLWRRRQLTRPCARRAECRSRGFADAARGRSGPFVCFARAEPEGDLTARCGRVRRKRPFPRGFFSFSYE